MLALLLAARAALTFGHSMWAWSLNTQRFLDPWLGWGSWTLAALALVPPWARRIAPWVARAGDAIDRAPARSMFLWAVAAGALAWLTPDRVWFVGDFLMRQGLVREGESPAVLFPQALPLDILLHYHLPRYLTGTALVDANGAARILGALEAAAMGALAVAFARGLELPGSARFASAAVLLFGGYLGLFTGFPKAFAELCLLVACTAVFGLKVLKQGRGLLPLGLTLAIGVALHRAALGLLPAVALAFGLWLAERGRRGAWRRREVLLALAVPLAALAVMVPRIVAVVARWDTVHFTPKTVQLEGGVLKAALAGARPADLANLLVMLSPLSVTIPLLLPGVLSASDRAEARTRRREGLLLGTLALPFLAVMPFIHPAQGLFRDWDDFAATGVAVSLLAAWTVAHAIRLAPHRVWLAVAVVAGAMAPTVQWLAHHRDVERGLQRVRAFMLEPPRRTDAERGTTWDYLGLRYFALERWDAAAEAYANAAETAPTSRILQQQAMAETMRRRYRKAQQLYLKMVVVDPGNVFGWLGLGTTSAHAGDWAEARRAGHELLRLQPGNPDALHLLEAVDRLEARSRPSP
ncbi:MAG TPA: hypothetical protein VGK93_12005 [Candidatus Eisenbacteria bacterium]